MKINVLFFEALLILFTASCSNSDDLITSDELNTKEQSNDGLNSEKIARMLVSINKDNVLFTEVRSRVASALKDGKDEEIRFDEILSDSNCDTRFKNNSLLKNEIINYINNQKTRTTVNSKTINSDINLKDLEVSNYEIYFPYSDNFNNTQTPVIAFVKDGIDEDDAEECYAIKERLVNNSIVLDTIIINEQYAELNPVWLIKQKSHYQMILL